jgi:hypothetical protein
MDFDFSDEQEQLRDAVRLWWAHKVSGPIAGDDDNEWRPSHLDIGGHAGGHVVHLCLNAANCIAMRKVAIIPLPPVTVPA